MDNASEIKGKIGEKLAAALDHLPLSYQLATIKCDVEVESDLDTFKLQEPNKDELIALYGECEFRRWLAELLDNPKDTETHLAVPTEANEVPKVAEAQYETILTESQFDALIEQLNDAELFAFDTETTSLDYMQAQLVGMSFAVKAGEAAYLPVAHDYPGAPEQLSLEFVMQKLGPILADAKKAKVGQNLKYDKSVLANAGYELNGIKFDTMLESYVLNSVGTRHDMDSLALKFLGHKNISFEDIAGKGKKQLTFNQVELDKAGPYAAEDADITLRLHQVLWPKLAADEKLKSVFEDIEMPLVNVISDIERTGVAIDTQNACCAQPTLRRAFIGAGKKKRMK